MQSIAGRVALQTCLQRCHHERLYGMRTQQGNPVCCITTYAEYSERIVGLKSQSRPKVEGPQRPMTCLSSQPECLPFNVFSLSLPELAKRPFKKNYGGTFLTGRFRPEQPPNFVICRASHRPLKSVTVEA